MTHDLYPASAHRFHARDAGRMTRAEATGLLDAALWRILQMRAQVDPRANYPAWLALLDAGQTVARLIPDVPLAEPSALLGTRFDGVIFDEHGPSPESVRNVDILDDSDEFKHSIYDLDRTGQDLPEETGD